MIIASVWGVSGSAGAAPAEYTYATMSDGVSIALAIRLPDAYTSDRTWPAVFEMSGYAGDVYAYASPYDGYVTVRASVRGTGCSGGQLSVFSDRTALDGYEIVEDWIVEQSWSDGRVALTGHSWRGLNSFLVAAKDPPSVRAVAVSGLIDDAYDGISYIGGVPNAGFPIGWLGDRLLPKSEQTAFAARGDAQCVANIATRPPQDPVLAHAVVRQWRDDFWSALSLGTYAERIQAPIHIAHMYQDEQTGPSGARLWERIRDGVPKRLFLTNGDHTTFAAARDDQQAWLDCWVLANGCPGDIADPQARVQIRFETIGEDHYTGVPATRTDIVMQAPLVAEDWPLPDTTWQRLYLRGGGSLRVEPPGSPEPGAAFVASPENAAGEFWQLGAVIPQAATYTHTFSADTAVAGPIGLQLWATSTAPDTDFHAVLYDVAPDGQKRQPLQRGLLRASHRALDLGRSSVVASGPQAGAIYRPYHPHTIGSVAPVVPGEPTEYLIEVFPLGHVFRAGHALRLEITTPRGKDPVGFTYQYASNQPPGVNTVLHDPEHRSSLLLPVLPQMPPVPATVPACGTQAGLLCM